MCNPTQATCGCCAAHTKPAASAVLSRVRECGPSIILSGTQKAALALYASTPEGCDDLRCRCDDRAWIPFAELLRRAIAEGSALRSGSVPVAA